MPRFDELRQSINKIAVLFRHNELLLPALFF